MVQTIKHKQSTKRTIHRKNYKKTQKGSGKINLLKQLFGKKKEPVKNTTAKTISEINALGDVDFSILLDLLDLKTIQYLNVTNYKDKIWNVIGGNEKLESFIDNFLNDKMQKKLKDLDNKDNLETLKSALSELFNLIEKDLRFTKKKHSEPIYEKMINNPKQESQYVAYTPPPISLTKPIIPPPIPPPRPTTPKPTKNTHKYRTYVAENIYNTVKHANVTATDKKTESYQNLNESIANAIDKIVTVENAINIAKQNCEATQELDCVGLNEIDKKLKQTKKKIEQERENYDATYVNLLSLNPATQNTKGNMYGNYTDQFRTSEDPKEPMYVNLKNALPPNNVIQRQPIPRPRATTTTRMNNEALITSSNI